MSEVLPEATDRPTEAGETELPPGWARSPLSEVCEINPAKPSSDEQEPERLVSFVPMPAVDADVGAITRAQERRFSDVRKGFTAFRDGDVIMAKITPCMENGKAAIASGLTNGLGFGSTEFHVLRPTGAVLPEFVYYFIRQESFRRAAESEMTGSVGQKRVPAEFMRLAEIPLAPIAEQGRIVAKVKELLARVGAVSERLAGTPAILKRFRQAVLAAACEGRLTEQWRHLKGPASELPPVDAAEPLPQGWTWLDLPSAGFLGRGKSRHRPRNAPHLYGGRYPFIQTGDVAGSDGRITSHSQTYNEAGVAQSRLWPTGTVCITIAANIADSAILTYPACFPDSVVGFIANPKVCDARFVELFIRTARRDLSQFAPATAQKNINIAILNEVRLPLPSLPEQTEIVRSVEALFKFADTAETRVAAVTALVAKLSQAILAKAFRGELVPTEAELARREGRSYETAGTLLERVRAQCAGAKTKADRRSKRWSSST